MELQQIRWLKVFLILCFSVLPEVVFSFEDTFNKVKIGSASSEGTDPCNGQNCPVVPNQSCPNCPVCCNFSLLFTDLSPVVIFQFRDIYQFFSMTEDVLYKELFTKTLYRPPQSII